MKTLAPKRSETHFKPPTADSLGVLSFRLLRHGHSPNIRGLVVGEEVKISKGRWKDTICYAKSITKEGDGYIMIELETVRPVDNDYRSAGQFYKQNPPRQPTLSLQGPQPQAQPKPQPVADTGPPVACTGPDVAYITTKQLLCNNLIGKPVTIMPLGVLGHERLHEEGVIYIPLPDYGVMLIYRSS